MIKAVIFDLDGVLIDSEKHHVNAEISMFRKYGIDFTHDAAKNYYGLGVRRFFEEVAKDFGVELPIEELLAEHKVIIEKYYSEVFPMSPNADVLLAGLSGKYQIGVSTSAARENAIAALKKHDLFQYIEELTGGDEVKNGKPDPEIFLKTAEKLGVSPGEAVVIEDAYSGMCGAKDGGMLVIGRRAAHNTDIDFGRADFVVEELTDIIPLLEKLNLKSI